MSESLMTRIARGDDSAVAACIEQYGSLVWAIARRLLRNQSDAEDAVQEIFTDVWLVIVTVASRKERDLAGGGCRRSVLLGRERRHSRCKTQRPDP